MNETEAALYLNTYHHKHFKTKVTPHAIKRWLGSGKITTLSESDLDMAVQTNKIPPKRGRPRTIPQQNIDDAIGAIECGMSQSKAAAMYGMSASMLSRVMRNERRKKEAALAFALIDYGVVDSFDEVDIAAYVSQRVLEVKR